MPNVNYPPGWAIGPDGEAIPPSVFARMVFGQDCSTTSDAISHALLSGTLGIGQHGIAQPSVARVQVIEPAIEIARTAIDESAYWAHDTGVPRRTGTRTGTWTGTWTWTRTGTGTRTRTWTWTEGTEQGESTMLERLQAGNVILVEERRSDGSQSIVIGKFVSANDTHITLVDAAWVSQTGRRGLFFAGTPDRNYEVEPYPDGMEVSIPAPYGLYSWPHPIPRMAV
jgi:hypothetical protein